MRWIVLLGLTACGAAAPPVPPVPPVATEPPAEEATSTRPPSTASASTSASTSTSTTRFGRESEIAFCVEETNKYRLATNRKPFQRSRELDAFAAEGAKHDARVRQPHHHFNTAQFPGSFSGLAENELPWWHLEAAGSVRTVIRDGIASMWAEGPGGGHYENLTGKYTEMGCGIYIDGEEITVVQDFRSP